MERVASCRCGQLTATCRGEPARVSVCHCRDCQARTGSAFGAQARFPIDDVTFAGEWRSWDRTTDEGNTGYDCWCPVCGTTIAYGSDGYPDSIALSLSAFADEMPAPTISVYEERRRPWVQITGTEVEHQH
jgi:hypothetical protein